MALVARVNPATTKGTKMAKKKAKGAKKNASHKGKKHNPSKGHKKKHKGKKRNPGSGSTKSAVMSLVKEGVGLGLGVIGAKAISALVLPEAYSTGTTGAIAQAAVGVGAGMLMKKVKFLAPYARGVQLGGIVAATTTLATPLVLTGVNAVTGAVGMKPIVTLGAMDTRLLTMGAFDPRLITNRQRPVQAPVGMRGFDNRSLVTTGAQLPG